MRIKELLKKIAHMGPLYPISEYIRNILPGRFVYNKLLTKYGHNTRIYIEHYPGTGDIYITCALLKKYHERNLEDKYVVTIIGAGAAKIAKLLGIEAVELLSQRQSDALIKYLCFMGNSVDNVTILHYAPGAMHTRILDDLACFNGLDFMTMYLSVVFTGMKWNDALKFQVGPMDFVQAREYLDINNLQPGKTVVLFPYANTIECFPVEFWEEFARHLRECGFSVCTNVEEGGAVIPGTTRVFVPYAVINSFVEQAGYVVGLRSGIFDIIADSNCEKYVLYPTPNFFKFGVGTIFDYFSLIKMNIAKKVHEYEFERIYVRDAFKCIYAGICKKNNLDNEVVRFDKLGDNARPELYVTVTERE